MKEKIEQTLKLLQRGERLACDLNPDGYFVAFSGGKDSQVLLQLVKMAGVKFKAYYSVTTNDPPTNVYFIRDKYPEVTFIHPKRTFFQLVEQKGLPTMNTRFCCSELKENCGAGHCVIDGVRAEESRKRSQYNEVMIKSRRKEHAVPPAQPHTIESIEAANHQCIKGQDKLMLHPILQWTELEIWEFLRAYNLPINPCYKTHGRVGCMFCPYSNRKNIAQYEAAWPKYREQLLRALQKYWDKFDSHIYSSAEDYYEWWKTKKNIQEYIASKQQYSLELSTEEE